MYYWHASLPLSTITCDQNMQTDRKLAKYGQVTCPCSLAQPSALCYNQERHQVSSQFSEFFHRSKISEFLLYRTWCKLAINYWTVRI